MNLAVSEEIMAISKEMTAIRRHIHQHPEIGFQEFQTSDLVASKLDEWGIDYHRGLAGTGIVATIEKGNGTKAIGLRADLDALEMTEGAEDRPHRSVYANKMHGCGHDGHTAMLLGAAKYLKQHSEFNGKVHLVFQPAEEGLGGASKMIEDGILEKFPMDSIYGLHNLPQLEIGKFSFTSGWASSGNNRFEINVQGKGCHAAIPQTGIDPIVISSAIVQGIQSIVSRNTDPRHSCVISITQLTAGDGAFNIIPDSAYMKGTIRYLDNSTIDVIRERLSTTVTSIAEAYGGKAELSFVGIDYIPVYNDPAATEICLNLAKRLFGDDCVIEVGPLPGSEDFAFFLEKLPGNYCLMGNGSTELGCILHNPEYDFNDKAIPYGIQYWVELTKTLLQ